MERFARKQNLDDTKKCSSRSFTKRSSVRLRSRFTRSSKTPNFAFACATCERGMTDKQTKKQTKGKMTPNERILLSLERGHGHTNCVLALLTEASPSYALVLAAIVANNSQVLREMFHLWQCRDDCSDGSNTGSNRGSFDAWKVTADVLFRNVYPFPTERAYEEVQNEFISFASSQDLLVSSTSSTSSTSFSFLSPRRFGYCRWAIRHAIKIDSVAGYNTFVKVLANLICFGKENMKERLKRVDWKWEKRISKWIDAHSSKQLTSKTQFPLPSMSCARKSADFN